MPAIGMNRRFPYHLELVAERLLINEPAAEAFSREPEAAHITASAVFREWDQEAKPQDQAIALEALKRLHNLRTLRMRLSCETMDAVIASDLPLDQLHTLQIEVQEANAQSLAILLSRFPSLRTLSVCPLVRDVRQDEPPSELRLPQLQAYTQTSNHALYREPLVAAWRALRSLSVFSSGTLPDLSGLVALSRLTLKMITLGAELRPGTDLRVHDALLGCRRLRHLDVFFYWTAVEPLMDTLAALVRQLSTLTLRLYGHATDNCPVLKAHAARFFPHEAPSALRSLTVEVQVNALAPADRRSFARLGRAVTPVSRARRVAFFLGTTTA